MKKLKMYMVDSCKNISRFKWMQKRKWQINATKKISFGSDSILLHEVLKLILKMSGNKGNIKEREREKVILLLLVYVYPQMQRGNDMGFEVGIELRRNSLQ